MFIDASAIVAILNRECGYQEIVERIKDGRNDRFVSPLVRFEAVTAVARSRSGAIRPTLEQFKQAEQLVSDFCIRINAQDIAITPNIGLCALETARTFGKYVSHEANLNFGDCFAYACASYQNCPLIYKRNDFSNTGWA